MYNTVFVTAGDRKFTIEFLAQQTNRQLLKQFRELIFEHAWILPCTQRPPYLYLGEPARKQLKRLEWEIGEYAVEITKRGYNISKIGF